MGGCTSDDNKLFWCEYPQHIIKIDENNIFNLQDAALYTLKKVESIKKELPRIEKTYSAFFELCISVTLHCYYEELNKPVKKVSLLLDKYWSDFLNKYNIIPNIDVKFIYQ